MDEENVTAIQPQIIEKKVIVYKRPPNTGIVEGLAACFLGILGIFTIGSIIFLPIAALLTLRGLVYSICSISIFGILLALIAAVITSVGFITSPVTCLTLLAIFKFVLLKLSTHQ